MTLPACIPLLLLIWASALPALCVEGAAPPAELKAPSAMLPGLRAPRHEIDITPNLTLNLAPDFPLAALAGLRATSPQLPAASQAVGQVTAAGTVPIPPHGPPVVLFDGSNLNSFDSFLRGRGLNSDPEQVFRLEDGVIHVSGKEFGYLISKQAFHNYYLRAEFKWGEGTYGERAGQARDSGILYNIQGEQKVWPRSIEFQILEGGTGDFWMTDGAALTGRDGQRVTGPPGSAMKIDRIGKGPSKNIAGFRDPVGEVENAHGEWNLLELVINGDNIKQYVNGKLANEGTAPSPQEGKVLFQSEGAEVYFRDICLYPLK